MLLIITTLMILALQGDADALIRKNYYKSENITKVDSLAHSSGITTKIISDNYSSEQLIEDTSISDSKNWIIEKESILGY